MIMEWVMIANRFISVVLFYMAGTTSVFAQEEPFSIGSKPQHYVSTGVTTGASFAGHGNGGFLGVEGSYVRASKGKWLGLYTDGFYDFVQGTTTITTGPVAGISRRYFS